jgi:hypothetical protein
MESVLKIEYIPVSKLKPYEKNARKHEKASIEAIANSIQQFGFDDPVGIWGENFIVEGHGRVQAAKKLGMKEVPCIRLDHLNDEQRRAYAIAHNKTAEVSDWDYELLDLEINDLPDFDFEDFGFEIRDAELDHERNAERTQAQVENILDLGRGTYPGVGRYDIPQLHPVKRLPKIEEWIGFNYVLSDKEPEKKAVHFFVDDYQFERLWKNPEKYVDKLRQYVCVATPDFSPYADMPMVCQLYNHYRKHWIGAYLQANGVKVIPTIRASTDPRSLDWYLEGEPKGGIVLISDMWTKTEETKAGFLREYQGMMDQLKPVKVFVYGKEMELPGNVEFISTFAAKRWGR